MARVHGAEMKRRSSHELSGLATLRAAVVGGFPAGGPLGRRLKRKRPPQKRGPKSRVYR